MTETRNESGDMLQKYGDIAGGLDSENVPLDQVSVTLENATARREYLAKLSSYFQDKAKADSEAAMSTNTDIERYHLEIAEFRQKLEKVEVDESQHLSEDQLESFSRLKNVLIASPRLARLLVDDDFLRQLDESFKNRIEELKTQMHQAREGGIRAFIAAQEEIEEFILTGPLNDRLEHALSAIRDYYDRMAESFTESASDSEVERMKLAEVKAELESAKQELEKNVHDLSERILNQQGQITQDKADLDSMRSRAEQAEKENADLERRKREGEDAAAKSLLDATKEYEAWAHRYTTRLEDLIKENQSLSTRVTESDRKLGVSSSQLEAVTRENDGLKSRLSESNERRRRNVEQLEAASQEAQFLKSKVADSEGRLGLAMQDLKSLESVRADNVTLREDYKKIVHQNSGFSSRNLELVDRNTGLSNDLEGTRAEKMASDRLLASTQDEIKKLKARLARSDVEEARDEVVTISQDFLMRLRRFCIRSTAISQMPLDQMSQLLARVEAQTNDPSTIDQARILDATNSDLPEGARLIADEEPGVFIWMSSEGVSVFDSQMIKKIHVRLRQETILVLHGFLLDGLTEIELNGRAHNSSVALRNWLSYIREKVVFGGE